MAVKSTTATRDAWRAPRLSINQIPRATSVAPSTGQKLLRAANGNRANNASAAVLKACE